MFGTDNHIDTGNGPDHLQANLSITTDNNHKRVGVTS